MAKQKEQERMVPADLRAMTLEELERLDEQYDLRSERGKAEHLRLLAIRDKAQADLVAFGQKRRDITSAIVEKYEQMRTEKGS